MNFRTLPLLAALLGLLVQGCAAVVIGGAVAGGAMVVNDRRTMGTMIDDEGVELRAVKSFHADEGLKENTHINVTSFNGIVLLTGEAPTHELRDRAEQLVKSEAHVKQVHNEIQIAAPSALGSRSSDSTITLQVKTDLVRYGDSRGFNGTKVKVVTENGTVYLMGLLSRHEADGAVEIARSVGGVQRVVKVFEYTG